MEVQRELRRNAGREDAFQQSDQRTRNRGRSRCARAARSTALAARVVDRAYSLRRGDRNHLAAHPDLRVTDHELPTSRVRR